MEEKIMETNYFVRFKYTTGEKPYLTEKEDYEFISLDTESICKDYVKSSLSKKVNKEVKDIISINKL